MRVVVIGAGGYLGGVILDTLVINGHDAIGVMRGSPGLAERPGAGAVEKKFLDATAPDFPEQVVALRADVIVYCISLNHFESEGSIHESLAVNVAPLGELARKAVSSNPTCKFIYLSTLQVYGPLSGGDQVNERCQPKPHNIYAATHLFCEEILRLLGKTTDLSSVSVRLSNAFGPPAFSGSRSDWLVMNDFCRSAVFEGEIVMQSDGSAMRDFVFVDDVASVVERLCRQAESLTGTHVFNLAAGESLPLSQVAEAVSQKAADVMGCSTPIRYVQDRKDYSARQEPFVVSTDALEETIGGLELRPFWQGIEANLRYFQRLRESVFR